MIWPSDEIKKEPYEISRVFNGAIQIRKFTTVGFDFNIDLNLTSARQKQKVK